MRRTVVCGFTRQTHFSKQESFKLSVRYKVYPKATQHATGILREPGLGALLLGQVFCK